MTDLFAFDIEVGNVLGGTFFLGERGCFCSSSDRKSRASRSGFSRNDTEPYTHFQTIAVKLNSYF